MVPRVWRSGVSSTSTNLLAVVAVEMVADVRISFGLFVQHQQVRIAVLIEVRRDRTTAAAMRIVGTPGAGDLAEGVVGLMKIKLVGIAGCAIPLAGTPDTVDVGHLVTIEVDHHATVTILACRNGPGESSGELARALLPQHWPFLAMTAQDNVNTAVLIQVPDHALALSGQWCRHAGLPGNIDGGDRMSYSAG